MITPKLEEPLDLLRFHFLTTSVLLLKCLEDEILPLLADVKQTLIGTVY